MPGAEAAEFLHHSSLAALKISDFVGREELVQQALVIIQQRTTRPGSAISAVIADGIAAMSVDSAASSSAHLAATSTFSSSEAGGLIRDKTNIAPISALR